MPYIPADKRPELDALTAPLVQYFKDNVPEDERDGALNYTITTLVRQLYPLRYSHQNAAVGVLTCVLLEHYRTVVGPYEDVKIVENGDLPRYGE